MSLSAEDHPLTGGSGIRELAAGDVADAARTLAQAFCDDPLMSWILQVTIPALRAMLAAEVGDREGAEAAHRQPLPHAGVHVTGGAGAVAANTSGLPPGTEVVLAKLKPGDDGDPLSRREREVAGLVAEGLTNRQIAARLYIAERTAENHVQHILTKLGFNTRSRIAAWAANRQG